MALESQLDRIERILEQQSHRMSSFEESMGATASATQSHVAALEQVIDALAIATQNGFRLADERMNAFEQRVEQRFAAVDAGFDGLDKRFDGVDKRFDGIDRRLGRIETRVENLETETRLVREQTERRLTTLEARAD